MNTSAEIKIWDKRVGLIVWDDRKNYSSMQFDSAFISEGLELAPVLLPVKSLNSKERYSFNPANNDARETYKGLPAFIADSLPDAFGHKVINEWLQRQGRPENSINPVEHLCYIGKRGSGALEFFPPLPDKDNLLDINIESLVKLADEVLQGRTRFNTNIAKGAEAMTDLICVGTSAGGARAKVIIAFNEKTGEIKSGQIAEVPSGFEHWLLKLDGVQEIATLGKSGVHGRIEYAYHLMAKDCGIEMSECRLLEEGGRAHFMTRRFDRPGNGEKLYMQSLNAIANMNYNLRDTNTYEQAFNQLNRLNLPYKDKEQLYRRMVFNVVAKNCDDHTKNISFLMNKEGKWSLAPAYDMTYAYNPGSVWISRHLMGVNGKFDNISKSDLEITGEKKGIKNHKIIIEQVCDTVSQWKNYAKVANVDEYKCKEIEQNLNLVNLNIKF